MNNQEWIYNSPEYSYLKSAKKKGIIFNSFDIFWHDFNKDTFIVPANNISEEEIEKFKNQLKSNGLEIYNTFNKGLN